MNIKTNMIKDKHKPIFHPFKKIFVKPQLMTKLYMKKKHYILGFGLPLSRNLCQLSILNVQKLIKKKTTTTTKKKRQKTI